MRSRLTIVGSLLLLVSLLGSVPAGNTVAQVEGTPAAPAATPQAALGRALLLQAVLGQPLDSPALVRLSRVTIDPGAELPEIGGADPTFVVMESGRASADVDGAAVLLPASDGDASERIVPSAGERFALRPGDQLALAAGASASLETRSDEGAALLVAAIVMAGAASAEANPIAATTGEGTTMQTLGEGRVDAVPGERAAVTLERFSLEAGLGMPPYAGPALVAVESGGFASTLDAGDVQVWRGDLPGTPPAIPTGGAFTVNAGEALFFPQGMEATPPLTGDGALTLLRLGILPLPEAALEEDQDEVAVVVTRDDVRLRSGPSTADSVIAGLVAGQSLLVTGPPVEGDGRLWYPVRDPIDATIVGYVAAEFLAAE